MNKDSQDLTCSICCELFRDPVVLICSHSFCKVCLENWWKDKPLKTCPVCKSNIYMDPPLNLALRNLVETFTEERRQTSPSPAQPECSLHSEKLRLFCEDHQDLICLVCRDSRTHKDHSFRPIEEAAQELREQLRRDLTPLQENLKVRDLTPLQENLKVRDLTPLQENLKVRDLTPLQGNLKVRDLTPLQEDLKVRDLTPLQENLKVRDLTPLQENLKVRDLLLLLLQSVERVHRAVSPAAEEHQRVLLQTEALSNSP
uniref:Uncharacterized protein n=1 Tax=Neogobius melanostomus TaxID=47308 RepID=A0A8C6SWT5_9GOBI